ncbi:MAG: AraC family transcriptional regulator ligand-binding domain-containing protein [Halioglobus sp.]|nr:AraC family transcriptional regulator ligand-binding domain-containing protein [Halioglobus sp.]
MQNRKHPSSAYARILFRHLRLREKNSRAYFAGTTITYDELMTLDGTIPRDDLTRIYRNALAISDREDLGLSVGTQFQLSAHGPLGVATFNSTDLRTGLKLLAKFGQTRTDFFDIAVNEHIEGLQVDFAETFDLGDLRVFVTEAVLSGFFSAITFFTGHKRFTGQTCLAYPKPTYAEKYSDHFGGHITFGQPATKIIVPQSLLLMPSPTADPVLYQEAVTICERQLREMKTGGNGDAAVSAEEAVSILIQNNPGKIWTLNQVAEKLSLSPRTLIRRLASEGTRFQRVRDELAKREVANYLTDATLSVESIAYLMGFSDVSSFRRSFKRWFGETPSHYIERIRGPSSRARNNDA